MILTLATLFLGLIGLVFAILTSVGSLNKQKSIKQLSKGLKRQKDVFKAYEEVNSLPPAPKAAVVKRLRNISAGTDALPELSTSKRKRS